MFQFKSSGDCTFSVVSLQFVDQVRLEMPHLLGTIKLILFTCVFKVEEGREFR